ncbi:redox-sensitive bicupin YhaK (pirin superfamily) [Kitasatospora sp. GP30]|uniref:pirin family protein n=1 Tax=Kitasatospora sp. GP30 TaxID=3035084 RepID=UPI000C7096ED|nr:pirin family protein [Kitasatospora sp. GP30]MDH6138871.1 redox-sensitive bicupin YhaK (pirin superfamily) [Kitasatospora sp. GP30]
MTDPSRPRADLRRTAERYVSEPAAGVLTRHAFSFSEHYDPKNLHFGALLACNEETLAPGAGFDEHRHRDTEILTWVLDGALAHRDTDGHAGVVRPGMVQYLSAGSGVAHTERNVGGADVPVRFVQMWLQPDVFGTDPAYGLRRVPEGDGLTLLASGMTRDADTEALRLRRSDAALWLVTAGPQQALPELPEAPYRYAHLTAGSLGYRTIPGPRGQGRSLDPGDSVRITGEAFAAPMAGDQGAQLLLWEMHSGLTYG